MKRIVNVSGLVIALEGEDKAVLYALWQATRFLKHPYRISRLPITGDGLRFLVEHQ